jgi:hypothetical protein
MSWWQEIAMGGIWKKNQPPKQEDGKPKPPAPPAPHDEDDDDGDIATPKRDRYGPDDEPL